MDKGGTQTNVPKDKEIKDDAFGLTSERWHRHTLWVKKIKKKSIEDSMDASKRGLDDFINKSKERLTTAASNSTDNIRTNRTTKTRKQKVEEKQLYRFQAKKKKKKMAKSLTRKPGHIYERQTFREREETRLGGDGDPLELFEIWPYHQMVYAQTRIRPRE